MLILSPVDRASEVPELVEAGAEELYAGYVPPFWAETFGPVVSCNRRSFDEANVGTFDDLGANLIEEFLRRVPRSLYTYDNTKHNAKFNNGSTIKFRYIAFADDLTSFGGWAFDNFGLSPTPPVFTGGSISGPSPAANVSVRPSGSTTRTSSGCISTSAARSRTSSM